MTLSSRLARVRITGSSCARLVAGVTNTAGVGRVRPCCPVWAETTPTNQTRQRYAFGRSMLSPSFAPQLGAILSRNPLNVCVNLFRGVVQPTRENRLLASRIRGYNQAKVAMKECLKLRQVRDSATHVFVDVERVSYAEVLSSRGHELHQAHRALRGNHARLPSRFDLNDGTHKSRRDSILLGVVTRTALLVLAHAERLPRKRGSYHAQRT